MAGHSVPVDPTDDHRSSAPDAGLDVEVADLRIEAEVEARRRERWIRDRLRADATLVGALTSAIDLDVTVHLRTGTRLTGRVVAVGTDVVGINTDVVAVGTDVVGIKTDVDLTWVALGAVTAVEAAAVLPAAGPGAEATSMDEVLHDLAERRAEVTMETAGQTPIRGTLVAAGELATVESRTGGRTSYVPVAAIVTIRAGG